MQATIEIDEALLRKAQRLTGLSEESVLVAAGLNVLIQTVEEQKRMQPARAAGDRIPGSARGLITIQAEDNDHLKDFEV